MISDVSGTCSDGFRTNVFPQTMANGRNHMGTIAGKLNGVMAAQTPTDCRIVSELIPRDTPSSTRPCMVIGDAQATSITSIARVTSARASERTLPPSRVTEAASSSILFRNCSRSAKINSVRSPIERERQSGQAALAAATAASTSSRPDSGARAITSPFAGFVTSTKLEAFAGTQRPPI